jgi:hypothetical protein
MTPKITDDDKGTVTATVDDKVVRSWVYSPTMRRSRAMSLAREYAEGWHDASDYHQKEVE